MQADWAATPYLVVVHDLVCQTKGVLCKKKFRRLQCDIDLIDIKNCEETRHQNQLNAAKA